MAEALRTDTGARLARALAGCLALQGEALRGHPDLAGFDAQAVAEALRDDLPDAQALRALVQSMALDECEHAAALLTLRGETDARLASLLELLQGSDHAPGPPRPTLGLLAALVAQAQAPSQSNSNSNSNVHSHSQAITVADTGARAPATAATIASLAQGGALACGLLQMADTGPLARRVLHMPLPLVTLLATGVLPPTIRLHHLGLRRLGAAQWPMPASWTAALLPVWAKPAGPQVVVLRGSDAMSDLEAAAQALAAAWGLQPLRLEAADGELTPQALQAHAVRAGLAPMLRAAQGVAVWHGPSAAGQAIRVPEIEGFASPWIVLAGTGVAVLADAQVPVVEIDLPQPGPQERIALWRALVPGTAANAPLAVVRDSRCGLSVLLRAAQLARSAQASKPSKPSKTSQTPKEDAHSGASPDAATALHAAVRGAARELSAWAQVSTDQVPVDTWVGQQEVSAALDLLLARCRAREDAARGLGPLLATRTPSGVKALFVGASGTGKTLAAQWIADRLARPLVRVDLGAVVSKYIGETEKNLGALLSRAEHVDAVLLFDEADSLFGARTDVRQANDRYANMQTNYLLQRLETFRGLAVLTSNSRARFDEAFVRRLDATIEFPLPDAAQRLRLWALHLGEQDDDTPALQALRQRVAALADLPGGHIRNAALTAALLARGRGAAAADAVQGEQGEQGEGAAAAAIAPADLVEALALEYRKLGLRLPEALQQQG